MIIRGLISLSILCVCSGLLILKLSRARKQTLGQAERIGLMLMLAGFPAFLGTWCWAIFRFVSSGNVGLADSVVGFLGPGELFMYLGGLVGGLFLVLLIARLIRGC